MLTCRFPSSLNDLNSETISNRDVYGVASHVRVLILELNQFKKNLSIMDEIFMTIVMIVLILVVSKYKKFSIEVGNWFRLKAEK